MHDAWHPRHAKHFKNAICPPLNPFDCGAISLLTGPARADGLLTPALAYR
jgi:hypothetical protein